MLSSNALNLPRAIWVIATISKPVPAGLAFVFANSHRACAFIDPAKYHIFKRIENLLLFGSFYFGAIADLFYMDKRFDEAMAK